MKTGITLFILSIFTFQQSQAQSLYMPRNVKAAFENGTRAINGNPGPHYWQNRSNYNIDVTVTPPDRTVKGSEEITYFNDSPDTLKTITFRLTLNFHKAEAAHAYSILPALDSTQITSGMHIDRIAVNGKQISWPELKGHFTWQDVSLPELLLPGDSVHFSIQWHQDIAPAFVNNQRALRQGMVDPTTWCVAYFYPSVAVYDDYNGWDQLPFTGGEEFYNDFSNYILKVHVPKNFIVWATGTLKNSDEVLQPHYAQLLKESMATDKIIHIATPADLARKAITAQNAMNTWIWEADDVTETVFFISDHDVWDASSVVVDSTSGRRVSVQAAYYDSSAGFHQAVAIGQRAISLLSHDLPGVAFPYPKMTVVEGFSGMEYPMMVNDGSGDEGPLSEADIENHEIAHTYFPFYMGINESRYAFMDEGWAKTFEYLISPKERNQYQDKSGDFYAAILENLQDQSQEIQVPIIEVNRQAGMAYTQNAYDKPMWAYLALKDLLGDQLFKKCLLGYMDRWHGKHPIPWDFFNSINDISGKNLNWFWNNWFFSHGYQDIGVAKVEKSKDGYLIKVRNTGGFAVPFDVKLKYGDGSSDYLHYTPIVWEENPEQTTVLIQTKRTIQSLVIDNGAWMDVNEKDNVWSAKY